MTSITNGTKSNAENASQDEGHINTANGKDTNNYSSSEHGQGEDDDEEDDGQGTTENSASYRRGPWSTEEDNKLLELVKQYGASSWVRISSALSTRTPKQARERYHQNLKPSLNRTPITAEEGAYIEELVKVYGKRWAEIARHLNGRSDNSIKNWWNGGANRRKRALKQVFLINEPESGNQTDNNQIDNSSQHLQNNVHSHQQQLQQHIPPAPFVSYPPAVQTSMPAPISSNNINYGNPTTKLPAPDFNTNIFNDGRSAGTNNEQQQQFNPLPLPIPSNYSSVSNNSSVNGGFAQPYPYGMRSGRSMSLDLRSDYDQQHPTAGPPSSQQGQTQQQLPYTLPPPHHLGHNFPSSSSSSTSYQQRSPPQPQLPQVQVQQQQQQQHMMLPSLRKRKLLEDTSSQQIRRHSAASIGSYLSQPYAMSGTTSPYPGSPLSHLSSRNSSIVSADCTPLTQVSNNSDMNLSSNLSTASRRSSYFVNLSNPPVGSSSPGESALSRLQQPMSVLGSNTISNNNSSTGQPLTSPNLLPRLSISGTSSPKFVLPSASNNNSNSTNIPMTMSHSLSNSNSLSNLNFSSVSPKLGATSNSGKPVLPSLNLNNSGTNNNATGQVFKKEFNFGKVVETDNQSISTPPVSSAAERKEDETKPNDDSGSGLKDEKQDAPVVDKIDTNDKTNSNDNGKPKDEKSNRMTISFLT